jgi:hypothetical protein
VPIPKSKNQGFSWSKLFSQRTSRSVARGALNPGGVKKYTDAVHSGTQSALSNDLAHHIESEAAVEASSHAFAHHEHEESEKKKKKKDIVGESYTPPKDPPVVLVLKRKSIRVYPQGERIAIYRNDRLGIKFAVPFPDGSPDNLHNKDEEIKGLASVSEAAKKYTEDDLHRQQTKTERIRKEFERFDKLAHPRVKNPWMAVGATIGGAVATSYVTDKVINSFRRKAERPNEKRHGGSYVYGEARRHDYYKPIDHLQTGKLGLKLGVLMATGTIGYDAGKRYYVHQKELDAKAARKKKKTTISEAPMARRRTTSPRDNEPRRKNSVRKPKAKIIRSYRPKGYYRSRLVGALGGAENVKSWAKSAGAGVALGAVVGSAAALATQKYHENQYEKKNRKNLHEIVPLVAAAAARVGPALLRAAPAAIRTAKIGGEVASGIHIGSMIKSATGGKPKTPKQKFDDTGNDVAAKKTTAATDDSSDIDESYAAAGRAAMKGIAAVKSSAMSMARRRAASGARMAGYRKTLDRANTTAFQRGVRGVKAGLGKAKRGAVGVGKVVGSFAAQTALITGATSLAAGALEKRAENQRRRRGGIDASPMVSEMTAAQAAARKRAATKMSLKNKKKKKTHHNKKKAATGPMKKVAIKAKKTFIAPGLGKELVKGGAIALGSAIATKLIDSGYDTWRDKRELKKAAKEAQIEKRAKSGKRAMSTKEATKLECFVHVDGSHSYLNESELGAIRSLHAALTPQNRIIMESLISESPARLNNIIHFAKDKHGNLR